MFRLKESIGSRKHPAGAIKIKTSEYNAICQNPNVFPRLTLGETLRLVQPSNPTIAVRIAEQMRHPPVSKPATHKGDDTTDFFPVSISIVEAQAIQDICINCEANAVDENGGTTGLASHYADLADIWENYINWLEVESAKEKSAKAANGAA